MQLRSADNSNADNSKVEVSDRTFGQDFNAALVHQAVTAYLAGARRGTKAQKTRAQVAGGGAKPWRQKGTGRARAGTIRSPIWRGGGVTFAAQPRSFRQKLNRKMYRAAMRSILSELARLDRLVIVEDFGVDQPRTRVVLNKLQECNLTSALLVTEQRDEKIHLAARNLRHVGYTAVAGLNPVNLIGIDNVVMTKAALNRVEAWLA
ncbi:MAG: 50S ribosomal protein L4 [Gammaproteobacteria bacterium]|nr:50S ribosomal protein L4 [Gammaproteobacteria bacterium]